MVTPSAGSIVLIPFPFSDLSQTKLRPAVVLADAMRGDWIMCQVTSNAYSDTKSVELKAEGFVSGSLQRVSFARPGKLFTANSSLISVEVGVLDAAILDQIIQGVINILQSTP